MAELTKWFQPNNKPVRRGVYETQYSMDGKLTFYQYWNGKYWGFTSRTAKDANFYRQSKSSWQSNKWRGLAQKP